MARLPPLRQMAADLRDSLPPSFKVFLARHATPDRAGYDLPYHLPPGPPLTERGIEEARELGAFLASQEVRYVFSSPLERTWTTAQIAAQPAQASLRVHPDLKEMLPEESWDAVLERMRPAFLDAARLSHEKDSPVALVTHGSPVLALLRWLGLAEAHVEAARIYDARTPLPPAGAWCAAWDGQNLNLRLEFVPAAQRYPEFAEIVG